MKKTLLATLVLGLCLTAALVGCDSGESIVLEEPIELDDTNFVDFWVEWWNRDSAEDGEIFANYGWDEDEVWSFRDDLLKDIERAENVIEMVRAKDMRAAAPLEWTVRLNFGSWHIETVDSRGDVGRTNSLALDSDDHPHISYYDWGNRNLKYARWDGSTWQIKNLGDGSCTAIVLDSDGHPHISYDSFDRGLMYTRWDGRRWHYRTVGGVVGWSTSLSLDSDGHPHIAYNEHWGGGTRGGDSENFLKYARWDGSRWRVETVDSGSSPPTSPSDWYTSLALDSDCQPHISYTAGGALKYARWDGTAWQIENVVSSLAWNKTSLVLDSAGHPHITYSGNANLMYAHWDGAAWHIETVDSDGSVGYSNSLALDSSGNPHISYRDTGNQNLKYARWDGIDWHIETVDSDGNLGSWLSLALDSAGYPHISYYDSDNEDLKYAVFR